MSFLRLKPENFYVGQELHVFGEISEALLHKYNHIDVDWIENRCQLRYWTSSAVNAPLAVIEVLVKTALFSFRELWYLEKSDASKDEFAKIKKQAISFCSFTPTESFMAMSLTT